MVQERKTYSKLPSTARKSYGSRFNSNAEPVASSRENKNRFARETKKNGPNIYLGSSTSASNTPSNEQARNRESSNSAALSRNSDREAEARRNRSNLSSSSSYRPSTSTNTPAQAAPVNHLSERKTSLTQRSTTGLRSLPTEPSALRKRNERASLLEYTKLSKNRGEKDNIANPNLRTKREKTCHVYSHRLVTHCLVKGGERRRSKWGRNSRQVEPPSGLPYVLDLDAGSQFLAYISDDRKLLIGELTNSMESLSRIDKRGTSLIKYGTTRTRGFSWSRRYPGVFGIITTEQAFGNPEKHFIKLFEKTTHTGLQQIKSVEVEQPLIDCVFSPDNRYLAVLLEDNKLTLYSSDLEILHQTIDVHGNCTSINWHPSAKLLHLGTDAGECLIYSEESPESWILKTKMDISHCAVTNIVCDTRGQLVLFASSDGNLQVFSLENYTKINSFESEKGYAILNIDLSSDGHVVYISYVDEETKEVYVCFYHWPTNTKIHEEANFSFAKATNQKVGFLSVSQGAIYSHLLPPLKN